MQLKFKLLDFSSHKFSVVISFFEQIIGNKPRKLCSTFKKTVIMATAMLTVIYTSILHENNLNFSEEDIDNKET